MLSVMGISRRSLLAAALGLALVAPVGAETVTVTGITSAVGSKATLTVPTVELTDANLSEDEVRAFFTPGTVAERAETLIGLTARSINIPELRVQEPMGVPGAEGTLVLSGVMLTDVANGIAGGFSVESALLEGKEGKVEFGPFSLTSLNVEHLFALHGIGNTASLDPHDLESIWSALSLGGATASGPEGNCTIAGIDGGALAVRMLQRGTLHTLFDQIEKVQKLQGRDMEPPTLPADTTVTEEPAESTAETEAPAEPVEPEQPAEPQRAAADELALLQSYYYDALSSYAADAVTFSGIECNVQSDAGDPVLVRAGEIAFGEAQPGTLPEITLGNLRIENSGADEGWIEMQEMRIFSTDYASVAELFEEAGVGVDGNFLEAKPRELIPSFGGFEMIGLAMDVPSDQSPGTRVQGEIGAFTMLLDSYVHGIPTDIRTSATEVNFRPPDDASGAMLASLGLDPFLLSYDVSVHWDRAAQEIVVDNLMMSAANAGTIIISGVIGNAKPQLFSLNQSAMFRASQGLTLKELHLHIADAGLLPKLIAMIAQQQNVEPDQFRAALAAMTQGILLVGLAATPDSIQVARAIGNFVSAGGELSISAIALSPAGIGLAEMREGQADPTLLIRKFALTAGEPEEEAAESAAEAPAAEETSPAEQAAPEGGAATDSNASAAPGAGDTSKQKDDY